MLAHNPFILSESLAELRTIEAKKQASEPCRKCSELQVRGTDETIYYCSEFYHNVDPENCRIYRLKQLIEDIDKMITPQTTNRDSGNYEQIIIRLEEINKL